MDRNSYGAVAEQISQLTDAAQLQQMLRNPQYSGYTGVIIARLSEINRMRQAQQAQQPQPPTVAQQAVQGQAPQPEQGMAKGGEIRRFGFGGFLGDLTSKAANIVEPVFSAPFDFLKYGMSASGNPSAATANNSGSGSGASSPTAPNSSPMAPSQMVAGTDPFVTPQAPAVIDQGSAWNPGMAPTPSQYQASLYQPSNTMLSSWAPATPTVAQMNIGKMAGGGIVAFRHGGRIRKFDVGGTTGPTTGIPQGNYGLPVLAQDQMMQMQAQNAQDARNGFAQGGGIRRFDKGGHTWYNSDNPESPVGAARRHIWDAMWAGSAPPTPDEPPALPPAAAPAPPPAATPAAPAPVALPPMNAGAYKYSAPPGMDVGVGIRGNTPGNIRFDPAEYAQIRDAMTNNPEEAENRTNTQADRARIQQNMAQNPYLGMMTAGFGMAQSASEHPHLGILGNLATGAGQAMPQYIKEGNQQVQELRDVNRIQMMADRAQSQAAAREYGSIMQANRMGGAYSAMARAASQPAMLNEQHALAYAKDQEQRDRADIAAGKIPPTALKSPQQYIMDARAKVAQAGSPYQVAQANNASRQMIATENGYNKWAATQPMVNGQPPSPARYQQLLTQLDPQAVAAEGGTGIASLPPSGAPAADLTQAQ